MADTIFLTGGTGFLGTELLARLIHIEGVRIYVLIRAESEEEAYHRMKAAWYHDRELYHAIGECIIPITGDFSKEGLMLDEDHRVMLAHDVTLVIHAGAEIGFQKDKKELITTNYIGTKNMLSFAHTIQNLRRFVHISTAYVAGRTSGVIMENEPAGKAFSSIYEKSKAKAEMLVRNSSLPHTICRPGMIVGDSATGWVRSFNTIYYVLKLLLSGDMRVIPVHKDTPVNIVPCDYVADSVIVEVRPDGELIVSGPQVALGYYGLASENIDHGTLKTGDLGKLDGRGHITLHGRKKDFIITAYGKNISIPKIEERLKDIPGVSEAVLIGENRPYCTALIWLDGDVHGLDAQIDRMNNGLSHPEQIRRYKIIDTPLSIQAGELTPNLKVKRGNVEEHYAKEIEEMYLS